MPDARTVADVMSRPAITIGRNETLLAADARMTEAGIRHLVVLDDDGMVAGVLSRRDLFRGTLASALGYGSHAQERMLESLLVKEAMSTEPVVTSPGTSLADAAKTLIARRIGCLPVLEGTKLVGVLTEGDFVRLAAREG
jgi:CBS domain-containing protein